jgi:hypothetical protein
VEFEDERAQRAYERLRRSAETAAQSSDTAKAAAGQKLVDMLDALESSAEVVHIQSGWIVDGFGTRKDGSGWGLQVARFGLRTSAETRMAHELGHAYAAMIEGKYTEHREHSNRRAVQAENWYRTIQGCGMRAQHGNFILIPNCR